MARSLLVSVCLLLAACADDPVLRIPATTAQSAPETAVGAASSVVTSVPGTDDIAGDTDPPQFETSEGVDVVDVLDGLMVFDGFDGGVLDTPLEPRPVLVARTPDQRRQGLMHVTDLEGWTGMWFVMDGPTSGGFWMKDTVMPLSIAFVDASSTVVAIADMEPCVTESCPVYEPGVLYTAALEVPSGMLPGLGIDLGAKVRLAF